MDELRTDAVLNETELTDVTGGAYVGPCIQYTVVKGDTLSKIAKQHFGNANAWKQIFEANRDTLDDPDRIFPGQVIKLPPKPADA